MKRLDPHKTICVIKKEGKKVGSIPATAPNASAYIDEMTRIYGNIMVEYEEDTTGGLLAALHGPRKSYY